MSFEPREYVRHILAEADYLTAHTRGLTLEVFLADPNLRRAFVRSLEVVGEAAKRVPVEVQVEIPGIEWKQMARMRDRLIHGYFGVDHDLVWDVVTTKIPQVQSILSAWLAGTDPLP